MKLRLTGITIISAVVVVAAGFAGISWLERDGKDVEGSPIVQPEVTLPNSLEGFWRCNTRSVDSTRARRLLIDEFILNINGESFSWSGSRHLPNAGGERSPRFHGTYDRHGFIKTEDTRVEFVPTSWRPTEFLDDGEHIKLPQPGDYSYRVEMQSEDRFSLTHSYSEPVECSRAL